MSSDEIPFILLRWCKDRSGIRLSNDYLRSWKAARPQAINNYEIAYTELVTEFLKTDLSITSLPVIQDEYDRNPIDTFPIGQLREGCGVVLQIQDTMDMRHSAFSLLNSLSNVTPVRQTYIENDDEVNVPRGMLQWVLTDGAKQIHAMEMEAIPGLDLKTPFGCKLLIKGCRVRRGMLLLTRDNVRVLGGDVVELYGGDMVAELISRCKRKLSLLEEPATPTPAENTTRRANPVTPIPTEIRSNTRPQTNYNTRQPTQDQMQTEEMFDDDMDYNDLVLGSIETAATPTAAEANKILTITPSDIFSDDDDFMDPPQVSPPRASVALTKRSNRTPVLQTTTKRAKMETNPIATATATATSSATATSEALLQSNQLVRNRPLPMDIDSNMPQDQIQSYSQETDSEEDASYIDPSVWENFRDAAENDSYEIDRQGRANCSFDTFKNTLVAMKGQTNIEVPDLFRVKLQCIKIAKLFMSKKHQFHLELELGDPVIKYEANVAHDDTVKAVFKSELLYELIGKDIQTVKNIFLTKGQAGVAKEVLKPFRKKVTQVVATLTLDMTVLESIEGGLEKPLIVGYEAV